MNRERSNKNLWTFLRNSPSFLFFLPAFFEKTPVPSPTMSPPVSTSAPPYARTDTPLRIAHSASSQFLPSPFTFTPNSLIQCVLRVKEILFFSPSPVKEISVKPSLASRCFRASYSRVVKAKKRKTADARATRARWGLRPVIGALSKRPVHSILSIVLMSTSNLKYTYCLLCMLLSCAFRYEVLD